MLIRLLVAVLTLVGPMPFRVCTCAASAPAQQPAGAPAPAAPAKVKKCRCADCGPAADTAAPGGTGSAKCEAALPSAPHDRDCPAVNPRPVVRDAGPTPVPDIPTDDGAVRTVIPSEPLTLAGAPAASGSERPHAPKTPLYNTFLTLRN